MLELLAIVRDDDALMNVGRMTEEINNDKNNVSLLEVPTIYYH